MHPDPKSWSQQDVHDFFEHEARTLVPDRAYAIEQALPQWHEAIRECQLTGKILLEFINKDGLRQLLNNNFPAFIAIGLCIELLEERSKAFANGNSTSIVTPPPTDVPHKSPSRKRHASSEPTTESPKDDSVQTKKLPKRLKPTALETVAQAYPDGGESEGPDTPEFLPKHGLKLKQIFFGETEGGQQIDYTPAKSITKPSHSRQSGQNFHFISGRKSLAESRFAAKHIRHFLHNPVQVTIGKGKTAAIVIQPYQSTAASVSAAFVFRQTEATATLAYVVNTPTGIRITTSSEFVKDDEFTYLLDKYGGDEEEASTIGSLGSQDASFSSTEEDSDGEAEAEEDDEEEPLGLSKNDIERHFGDLRESVQFAWQENILPRLEAKRARTVWDQQKYSHTTRYVLIEGANGRIAHCERRLQDMKDELMKSRFTTESEIKAIRGNLEPTIEQMEEWKWKIAVWQRRRRPTMLVKKAATTRGSGAGNRHGAINGASNAPTFRSFDPDDRFSVSSANTSPNTPQPAQEDMMTIDSPPEDQADPSQSQEKTNVTIETAVDDTVGQPTPFVVQDDIELDMHGLTKISSGQPGLRASSESLSQQTPSQYPAIRDLQNPIPTSTMASELLQHLGEDSKLPSRSPQEPELPLDDSDVDLLDPRELLPKRKEPASRPSIDLTSSSPRSSTSMQVGHDHKRRRRRTSTIQGSQADDLSNYTSKQIEEMDISKIVASKDRNKLLLKLVHALHSQDATFRERLMQLFQDLPKFHVILRVRLLLLRDNKDSQQVMSIAAGTAYKCLYLYLAWFFTRPDLDPDCYTTKEIKEVMQELTKQVELFTPRLKALLKHQHLWKHSPPNTPRRSLQKHLSSSTSRPKDSGSSPGTSEKPIALSSDDDTDLESALANHKGKKAKRSREGVTQRHRAHVRAEQFSQRQTSQTEATPSKQGGIGESIQYVINVSREEGQEALYIDQDIACHIKDHQVEGVRFMWRELTDDNDETVHGCLLADTMGLGKTMQTITTLVAIAQASQDVDLREQVSKDLHHKKCILIVCPPSLISNWEREIRQWDVKASLGDIYALDSGYAVYGQINWLQQWRDYGGVAIVGQHKFQAIVDAPAKKMEEGLKENPAFVLDPAYEQAQHLILSTAQIAVLDEAQSIKTKTSRINQAMTRVKARYRIALTGTPLSNALDEVYQLMSWVAPGYLGDEEEFKSIFSTPIKAGLFQDCAPSEHRLAIKRLAVLRADVEPKCLRRDITALKGYLPPKTEFLLKVALSPEQRDAYIRFLAALKTRNGTADGAQARILQCLTSLSLLTAHPWAFKTKMLTKQTPSKTKKANAAQKIMQQDNATASDPDAVLDHELPNDNEEEFYTHGFSDEVVAQIIGNLSDDIDPALSSKTALTWLICQNTLKLGDKLLIFSARLTTLTYLQRMLGSQGIPVGRIDGSVGIKYRNGVIQDFVNGKFQIMLVSVSAGGVGLNIQCANRVIIFDSGFNPMNEEQAVGRAYRLGQQKAVFVYRFTTGGTFEENMENLQFIKKTLATRVVDKKDYMRIAKKNIDEWLYDPKTVSAKDISSWIGKDPGVLDDIIKQQLAITTEGDSTAQHMIYSIITTETLQIDATDEALDEAEKAEVQAEITKGRMTRAQARRLAAQQAASTA